MTYPNSHKPSSRRAVRLTDGGKGSAATRRARKHWLIAQRGSQRLGVVQCAMCSTLLTFETLTVDRWPIPGWKGGTYRRNNVRPACRTCNVSDGGSMGRRRQLTAHTQRACRDCGFVAHQRYLVKSGTWWRCKSVNACARRCKGLSLQANALAAAGRLKALQDRRAS